MSAKPFFAGEVRWLKGMRAAVIGAHNQEPIAVARGGEHDRAVAAFRSLRRHLFAGWRGSCPQRREGRGNESGELALRKFILLNWRRWRRQ